MGWRVKQRILGAFLALIMVVPLVSGCGQQAGGGKEPYKIGAVLSLTGYMSLMATGARDAAQLAVDQANKAGGINGHPVELIVEDDRSEPSPSVTAATKLINEDKVLAIIGSTVSAGSSAMKPILEKAGVPQVSYAILSPDVLAQGEGQKWLFKTVPYSDMEAEHMLQYLSKQTKVKKVGMLFDSNPYGTGIKVQTEKMASKYGITLVGAETYKSTDTDFSPQLTRIKAANPDALLVAGAGSAPGIIAKSRKEIGFNAPIYGYQAVLWDDFVRIAGDAAEGAILQSQPIVAWETLPDSEPRKGVVTKFVKDFTDKYGRAPQSGADVGYDMATIVINALKSSGADRAKLRDAIEKTDMVGLVAVYKYTPTDHAGITPDALINYTIKNGKAVFLK